MLPTTDTRGKIVTIDCYIGDHSSSDRFLLLLDGHDRMVAAEELPARDTNQQLD